VAIEINIGSQREKFFAVRFGWLNEVFLQEHSAVLPFRTACVARLLLFPRLARDFGFGEVFLQEHSRDDSSMCVQGWLARRFLFRPGIHGGDAHDTRWPYCPGSNWSWSVSLSVPAGTLWHMPVQNSPLLVRSCFQASAWRLHLEKCSCRNIVENFRALCYRDKPKRRCSLYIVPLSSKYRSVNSSSLAVLAFISHLFTDLVIALLMVHNDTLALLHFATYFDRVPTSAPTCGRLAALCISI
jgi:hypothetical protein